MCSKIRKEMYENTEEQMGIQRQKCISKQPAQNLLELIHCLCSSLSCSVPQERDWVTSMPSCLWRRTLQIFSCCSVAMRRTCLGNETEMYGSHTLPKAVADIILVGSVQGKPPHPAAQNTDRCFQKRGGKSRGGQGSEQSGTGSWRFEGGSISDSQTTKRDLSGQTLWFCLKRRRRHLRGSAACAERFSDGMGHRTQREDNKAKSKL